MATKLLRWLLPLLGIFAPAAAQEFDFGGVLKSTFEFIGPGGLDFLLAFGITFAAVQTALSLVPAFKSTGLGKSSGPATVIAMLMALATAAYVLLNEIAFFALIAPFGLFIVVLLIVIGIIKVALSAKEGNLKGVGMAFTIGFLLFVAALGMMFVPGLVLIGSALFFIGILILIIAFLVWLAGREWTFSGFPKFRRKRRASEEIKEVEREEQLEEVEESAEEKKQINLLEKLKQDIAELKSIAQRAASGQASIATSMKAYSKRFRNIIVSGEFLAGFGAQISAAEAKDIAVNITNLELAVNDFTRRNLADLTDPRETMKYIRQLEETRTTQIDKATIDAYKAIGYYLRVAENYFEQRQWFRVMEELGQAEQRVNAIVRLVEQSRAIRAKEEEAYRRLPGQEVVVEKEEEVVEPEERRLKTKLPELLEILQLDIQQIRKIDAQLDQPLPPAATKAKLWKGLLSNVRRIEKTQKRKYTLIADIKKELGKIGRFGINVSAALADVNAIARDEGEVEVFLKAIDRLKKESRLGPEEIKRDLGGILAYLKQEETIEKSLKELVDRLPA